MMVPYITPPAVVGAAVLLHVRRQFRRGQRPPGPGRRARPLRRLAERSDRRASGSWSSAMVWYGTAADGADPARRAADDPGRALRGRRGRRRRARGSSFRHITLPHLMPSILFLVLLRTIWMSNHIDMIFVMTTGRARASRTTPRRSTASAHQPVPDRLRVGGRRRAGDHPGGGVRALRAPSRAHRADGVRVMSGSRQDNADLRNRRIVDRHRAPRSILLYSLGAVPLDRSSPRSRRS